MTRRFQDCDACVDAILEILGTRIVLGTPLGISKPNALLNALYRRAKADPSISLDIVTALSLNPPTGASDLEERFLKPVHMRIWSDYPRLDYLDDLTAQRLPPNVRVIEFYLRAASQLHNPQAQQDYISTNYTLVARDMLARGVNLLLQSVAAREADGVQCLSLSSNPDVTLQLLPLMKRLPRPWLAVGQVNRRLPWLGNRAEIEADEFHLLVDDPALDHEPFAVPHETVGTAEWAIGLQASRLVRDGGTLQVGIGALGDAACHCLRLRQRDSAHYQQALDALGSDPASDSIGGREPFEIGLYVASELISNPLFTLFEDGIVRRRVYEDEATQKAVDGVARGDAPPGGTVLQGAFFIGPGDFYERLRRLPEDRRALIDMTSVAEVNRIYTHYALERLQRRHPRFLNITMKVTLLGAAVSDQLAGGQVVSGVGGQQDFVSMAHQLPEGRSALMLKAVRGAGRRLESNIVWEYPHTTIARHHRDLIVTEYGVADLRAKTDRECIEALIAIADSRFQRRLADQAIAAGKLPPDYEVPPGRRRNLPSTLEAALDQYQRSGLLPRLPFGNDLNAEELALAATLGRLKAAAASWNGRLRLARAFLAPAPAARDDVAKALRHLALTEPKNAGERRSARLVRAAFRL